MRPVVIKQPVIPPALAAFGFLFVWWWMAPQHQLPQGSQGPPAMAHPNMKVVPAAQKLHDMMASATAEAAKKGQYDCCANPPCEFCAVHMAACPCGKNLANSKAVCRECKGAWDVGEGRIAGIKPQSVKAMSATQMIAMINKMPAASAGMAHKAPARK